MNYWLVKSDPETYSWHDLVKDKKTTWDGVRNFAARNHLKAMKKGDHVLVYHSNLGEVAGTAEIIKEAFTDTTAKEGNWVAVDLKALKSLKKPVLLSEIKSNKRLKDMLLLKISRLSVMPVKKEEFDEIMKMSDSK